MTWVKVWVRVRVSQIVVIVKVRVSPQEMNVSQVKAPTSDENQHLSVCVCACARVPKPTQAGMKNEDILKEAGVCNIQTHIFPLFNRWESSKVALVLRDKATGLKSLVAVSTEMT